MYLICRVLSIEGTIVSAAASIVLGPCTLNFLGIHSLAFSTNRFDAEGLVALDFDLAAQISTSLIGAHNKGVKVLWFQHLLQVAALRFVWVLKKINVCKYLDYELQVNEIDLRISKQD